MPRAYTNKFNDHGVPILSITKNKKNLKLINKINLYIFLGLVHQGTLENTLQTLFPNEGIFVCASLEIGVTVEVEIVQFDKGEI